LTKGVFSERFFTSQKETKPTVNDDAVKITSTTNATDDTTSASTTTTTAIPEEMQTSKKIPGQAVRSYNIQNGTTELILACFLFIFLYS
jgi:hypothetical protein